ncbi:hypothetical protein P22_3532 [Propionispora sp. 2/2-37]|uniref:hypothetical protein n=1 Tax=Propionispora sp. 2/2-37 TaxID=1677858 RepID=UPI0006C457D2|nr:hypothetical protein [Propionispora sp. 2/2-37]CUH97403.1 hypothetical protein P22_3532 [Propionispora sp. 2/2-37]
MQTKKRKKTSLKVNIIEMNQPSEQALNNFYRYVYERLLIILEEKCSHKGE